MKEKIIEVLMVEPGKEPSVTTLNNSLESLQEAVSICADCIGLIEIIPIDDDALILCNEEAKLIGLEPNRRLWSDVLCGVFYVVSQDEDGNLCSLSAENMEYYKKLFAVPEFISREEAEDALMMGFFII